MDSILKLIGKVVGFILFGAIMFVVGWMGKTFKGKKGKKETKVVVAEAVEVANA